MLNSRARGSAAVRILLVTSLVPACAVDDPPPAAATLDVATQEAALSARGRAGKQRFQTAFPQTNGRSCATCHLLDADTILPPAHVEALFAANPEDPLFHPLDADDPAASPLTFEHLKKGLIRVSFTLPDNMDVIDENGNVITAPDRKIAVWRGVPTVANTGTTGPYQLDGRAANLVDQAQAALTGHSEGPLAPRQQLIEIAQFERETFSSVRARFVAMQVELGVPPAEIPMPEGFLAFNAQEQRGRAVFEVACEACHGSATTNTITNRPVHDSLFFELAPDGNIIYDIVNGKPEPRLAPQPNNEFLNVGFSLISGYGQSRALPPMFNSSVELPRFRFRFYRDGTRAQQVVDLPPIPRDKDGNRTPLESGNLNIPVDSRGAPIVGPSLGVQWFSTDPGRAVITGNPLDFEAFDIPQLRGIARTAPYFHDNSQATLADAVDAYSRFVLPFAPALGLPGIHRDSPTSPFNESLTLDQKRDLLAFLLRL